MLDSCPNCGNSVSGEFDTKICDELGCGSWLCRECGEKYEDDFYRTLFFCTEHLFGENS